MGYPPDYFPKHMLPPPPCQHREYNPTDRHNNYCNKVDIDHTITPSVYDSLFKCRALQPSSFRTRSLSLTAHSWHRSAINNGCLPHMLHNPCAILPSCHLLWRVNVMPPLLDLNCIQNCRSV